MNLFDLFNRFNFGLNLSLNCRSYRGLGIVMTTLALSLGQNAAQAQPATSTPAMPDAMPAGAPPASAFKPGSPDPMLVEIPLDGGPLSHAGETWEFVFGGRSVRNVTRATLTPFVPEPPKATGTAVIVAPGGGFMGLSMDTEGYRVARQLADHGIAAFVLKYHLDPTPADPVGFIDAITRRIQNDRLSDPQAPWPVFPSEIPARDDGLAAVRWVRERAAQFKLQPDRIGFMGFSAGGMVTMRVATGYTDAASRPDFVAPIYGAMDRRTVVPADAPPMFIALAADDTLLAHMGVPMLAAWQKAKRPVELHLFETGGHAFGARGQGASSDVWMDNFLNWLRARGQLTRPVVARR